MGNDALTRIAEEARQFTSWWVSELRDFLPAQAQGARVRQNVLWAIAPNSGELDIRDPANPSAEGRPVSPTDAGRATLLLLGDDRALVREGWYPASAKPRLTAILALELSLETPFVADEVVADHRVLEEVDGQIRVSQAVASKEDVSGAIAAAREAGLRVIGVDVVGRKGAPAGFGLVPPELARQTKRAAAPPRWLAAAATGLAAAAALVWFVAPERLRADLAEQEAQLRLETQDALQARAFALAAQTQLADIAALRGDRPSTAALLAEIAAVLPPHAYVQAFRMEGDRVSLSGATASASETLVALERSPMFGAARFLAPVTRNQEGDQERFELELRLEQSGRTATSSGRATGGPA